MADKSVVEYIRQHVLESVGVFNIRKINKSPIQIIDSQMNWDFIGEMAYAMVMGYFRYGPREEQEKKYNYIDEAMNKIKLYRKTRNLECLRDAANYLMMERTKPSISGTYYKAMDDTHHAIERERI